MAHTMRIIALTAVLLLAGSCVVQPPTPSSEMLGPYQIQMHFSLEQEGTGDYTARARFFDLTQAFEWTGNMGTIELSEGDAAYADGTHLNIKTETIFLSTLRVDYS